MSDLERLDEAIEALELWDKHGFDWKEARNRYKSVMALVRAYRDLLANGERKRTVDVCTHGPMLYVEPGEYIVIPAKLLVDYATEQRSSERSVAEDAAVSAHNPKEAT